MRNTIERIFREPRLARGNTGITVQQPIDTAAWVWHGGLVGEIPGRIPRIVRFRAEFDASGEPLTFDISADERFVLKLDGAIVARGPNRGTVENWQYHTYRAGLEPGRHLLEATCWTIGAAAPLAQMSWRGGFIFKASGQYDAALTTGGEGSVWRAGVVPGLETAPSTPGSNAWGTGGTFIENGTGPLDAEPGEWTVPVIVREAVSNAPGSLHSGIRAAGWMLFPTQLPDQIECAVAPGSFRAASQGESGEAEGMTFTGEGASRQWFKTRAHAPHRYTAEDADSPYVAAFNALARQGRAVEIPANTTVRALWDLGDYYGIYPVVETSGGAGSEIFLGFHESLVDGDGLKGARDAFIGKELHGYGDVFRPAGGRGSFTPLWWRTGRWAEIIVRTGREPLEITRLSLFETRYPLEREGSFDNGDASLEAVQRICLRGMQMCCHEMLFDCPFYEQQMYPGDTRVQLLVLGALSRDERIIRRAIEIYDLNRRDDGTVPFNYPTRGTQEGASYTLCWLLMLGDYVMRHDCREWLRQRIPGMRHTLSGLDIFSDQDGILRELPGWNFLDWVLVNPYKTGSWAPGSIEGDDERGSILTLFWILALQGAARVERALGDETMAGYWEAKAARAGEGVIRVFWSEERGMVADTDRKNHFSEHAQALAIISGILDAAKCRRAEAALLEAPDLARATVYFSHYLFEAYFKIGRGDLFLKRLDLWRTYVKMGLRTPLESPDSDDGKAEARSDCHAWGSHPLYWLQSGTAGVMPAEPFFKSVRIAPQPGQSKFVRAKVPHPMGFIDVDLAFEGGKASGSVILPEGVSGVFAFGGAEKELSPGPNGI